MSLALIKAILIMILIAINMRWVFGQIFDLEIENDTDIRQL